MTQDEKDRIDRLLDQFADLNATQAALLATDKERENTRVLLRAKDDHWRDRMEAKTDGLVERLDAVSECVEQFPTVVDDKVASAIEAHRIAERGRAYLTINAVIAALIVAAFAVFATLEFIDHEDTAAVVLAAMACTTPFVIWILSRRRSGGT